MSTYTIPAIEGRMGSTRYYQAVMRADELAATVQAAMDFREFDTFMAHERMQRDLSEQRVEKMIVPYLTNSEDRFFGSIIVLVYQPDEFAFEPLTELGVSNLKGPYAVLQNTMGALTINGGMLFALDGQHRLHALRTVVNESKTPQLNLPIVGPYRDDVRGDMLSVIFLEFESTEKARRIFNKVNRYAKPTSESTNILTSEDDGIFIVTRCIASLDDPGKFDSDVTPPIPLHYGSSSVAVTQLEGKSMKPGARELFTVELIGKTIAAMCESTGQPPMDEQSTIVRPDDEVLRNAYEECARWWRELMESFTPFADALYLPSRVPAGRDPEEPFSLAYRPNGQEALVRGLMDAHKLTRLSPKTLVARLNDLPLSLGDDAWSGVLLGRGDVRRRPIAFKPLAANLVTYLLVGPDAYGARRTQRLLEAYIDAKDKIGVVRRVLPKPVV